MPTKYKIITYIPAEPDEEEIYESEADALAEIENLVLMQPENHYEIVEVEGGNDAEHLVLEPIPRAPRVEVYRISMVVAVAEDAVDAIHGSIEDGMEFNKDDGEGILEYDIKPETVGGGNAE